MLREGLFSLGLVLYPATQLRAGGLPVGPGELCLIGWIGLAALNRLLASRAFDPSMYSQPVVSRVLTFWIILALVLSHGMIVGLLVEPFFDLRSIAHDVLAYTLLMTMSVILALELGDPVRRLRTIWLVIFCGSAVLTLQLADGYDVLPISYTDPWFFDRFRGWSLDPNQLGLMVSTLTLLSIYLIENSNRTIEKFAAATAGTLAFAVGLLTKSDSYVICIMVAGAALLATNVWAGLRLSRNWRLRHALLVVAIFVLPAAALCVAPFARNILNYVEVQSTAVYEDDGQGDTRLGLWSEAFEVGINAKLVGFGPGAHLTSKSYKRPPPDKFEAHNTALDLFTQGGVIAVALFAWLCVSAFNRCWRARLPSLAALAIGFTVFSMFHFVIRHPIFWFGIVLCLVESARVIACERTTATRISPYGARPAS